ncbi:MAG: methyltransferase domain-containing protein [Candidatus Heimdallarchaeaceae archaeon]
MGSRTTLKLDGLENYGTSFAHLKNFLGEYGGEDIANIGGCGDESKIDAKIYDPLVIQGFDICKQTLPRKHKTIICLNTFEHLYDPIRAAENIIKSLKDGGYLFVTLPFYYHQHDYEDVPDYYRYTTTGVKYLFRKLKEIKLDLVSDETEGIVSENPCDSNLVIYIGKNEKN